MRPPVLSDLCLSLFVLSMISGCGSGVTGSVAIVVDPGPFESPLEAATAESRVVWHDADRGDDDACTESFAAVELQRHLAMCLGRGASEIAIVEPDELPDADIVILVGTARTNRLIGELGEVDAPALAEGPEAFRVYTARWQGVRAYVIEGTDRVGTLYGVYAFLERLGVSFYGLGENGAVFPEAPVRLPSSLRVAAAPAYVTRGFWAWEPRGNEAFFMWMARNGMNLWTSASPRVPLLKKLGIKLTAGGHDVQKRFLDPAAYFDSHPEWYGLVDGRRTGRIGFDSGVNFCTSNTHAVREFSRNLVIALTDGAWRDADVVVFWMLDQGRWCECEPCAAQGEPTDRLLAVLADVHASMRSARNEGRLHRPVDLTSLAYLETLHPPRRPVPEELMADDFAMTYFPIYRCYAHALADPACTEINQQQLAFFHAWTIDPARHFAGAMEIGEYYNIASFKSLPIVLTRVISEDVPFFHRAGVRRFHYMHVPTDLWGTWTLNHHILARLLWSPDVDARSIRDAFLRSYFPVTSERLDRFHDHVERATANLKLLKDEVLVGPYLVKLRRRMQSGGDPLPLKHMRSEPFHPTTDDGPDLAEMEESMEAARLEIDAALEECRDDRERVRVVEIERRFAYGEATLRFYRHLIAIYLADRAGDRELALAEWNTLEALADQLADVKDLVQVASSHANARDGLEATLMVELFESYRRLYGAPGER